jgi:hypothetical protein
VVCLVKVKVKVLLQEVNWSCLVLWLDNWLVLADYRRGIELKKGMKRNILLELGGVVRMMRFSEGCHLMKKRPRGGIHHLLAREGMDRDSE